MPSSYLVLRELARQRLEAISFFLFVLLLAAWGVQGLWNRLRSDFPKWPRLTYGRSVGLVVLWGGLCVVVLTMISGARELMTPGAWEPDGVTYRLAGDPPPATEEPLIARRSRRIEALSQVLADHIRRTVDLPPRDDVDEFDWTLPDRAGVRYVYRGPEVAQLVRERSGRLRESPFIVAFEPRVYGDDQFVLRANGSVLRMTTEELAAALASESDVEGNP